MHAIPTILFLASLAAGTLAQSWDSWHGLFFVSEEPHCHRLAQPIAPTDQVDRGQLSPDIQAARSKLQDCTRTSPCVKGSL